MTRRSSIAARAAGLVIAGIAAAAPAQGTSPATRGMGVSPLLVDAAAEVWGVVARPDNPVWPGWNASDTPLLLYLPGHQDLLINHPKPPAGFRPYRGPLALPGAAMWVKDGATLVSADGQNTAMEIGGVKTLVVADPLSNLRQRVAGLIEDPRPAAEKARALELGELTQDPYDQLGLVVHEAFHVFQARHFPTREANEMLLIHYPVLAIENNVGMGLEAEALNGALAATDPAARRAAAVRWLAIRQQRRSALATPAVEYEDGIEFSEGLAKYVEFRLFEVLEGRAPGPMLARAQGFAGYADLAARRLGMIDQMKRHLRGEVNVNNSLHGTAPLRMRLYYSGLAIGALLDRIAPGWKDSLGTTDSSLTALARDALRATPEELSAGLSAAAADSARPGLLVAKTRLAAEGERLIAGRIADLERGPGTQVVVSYGALPSTRVGLAFTPFGITRVDPDRIFFEQVPISAQFADGSTLDEQLALPVLRDTKRFELRLKLEERLTPAALARLAGAAAHRTAAPRPLKLALPGVTLDLKAATYALAGNTLRVTLHAAAADSARSR